MDTLTDRQQFILNHVIDTHIDTAQPVGSRTILDRFRVDYSSATVRYEMGVLEDRGYLEQPYTSSGRVPTDLGYRYYVDHTLPDETVEEDYESGIAESLGGNSGGLDSLSAEASRLLSGLSAEAGIVYICDSEERRVPGSGKYKLSVYGSSNFLEKPEFQNTMKLRALFEILEEKGRLADWMMDQDFSESVMVWIGQENKPEALQECSIVLDHYVAFDKTRCAVAVLGPRRMRYRQAVPLVENMAKVLGRVLDQRITR